jgi:hypothetical protein
MFLAPASRGSDFLCRFHDGEEAEKDGDLSNPAGMGDVTLRITDLYSG